MRATTLLMNFLKQCKTGFFGLQISRHSAYQRLKLLNINSPPSMLCSAECLFISNQCLLKKISVGLNAHSLYNIELKIPRLICLITFF